MALAYAVQWSSLLRAAYSSWHNNYFHCIIGVFITSHRTRRHTECYVLLTSACVPSLRHTLQRSEPGCWAHTCTCRMQGAALLLTSEQAEASPGAQSPHSCSFSPMQYGWEIWGCRTWRRVGSKQTSSWPFNIQRGLPRESVGAPSLEAFKARLDGALGSLSWWGAALPMAGGWNWVGFKVLSNPSCSVILWFHEPGTHRFYMVGVWSR